MKVLDLFSGIGGFSLGFERAGMETVAFCDTDPFCRAVLRKHWPNVPVYRDVTHVTVRSVQRLGPIDLVSGGFPCQPVSVAGAQQGEADDRWLWPELYRVLGEVKPRWFVGENVSGLLSANGGRLFGDILRDLAAIGFAVEWHCIPAFAVGAPHRRDRVWIIAHTDDAIRDESRGRNGQDRTSETEFKHDGEAQSVADTASSRRRPEGRPSETVSESGAFKRPTGCGSVLVHTGRELLERRLAESTEVPTQWTIEPDVGRVAHGVPSRVDRLRSLGNAVVPQIPEIIGRAIMRADAT